MTHAAIDLWYICVDRNNLLVDDNPEYVRHGDVVQLIHGITSRALNRSVPVFGQCHVCKTMVHIQASASRCPMRRRLMDAFMSFFNFF